MDDISKSIIRNVENGQYFKDALEWYSRRYLSPFVQRNMFFVLFLIFGLFFGILLLNAFNLFPLEKEYFYKLQAPKNGKLSYYMTEEFLKTRGVKSFEHLASKLAGNYVKTYEKYDYEEIKSQFNVIYNSSTKEVFDQFYHIMSLDNPRSPLHIYGRYGRRFVNVDNVTVYSDINGNFTQAEIDFTTRSITYNINIPNQKYKAIMSFYMSDLEKIKKDSDFEFVITSYRVNEVND